MSWFTPKDRPNNRKLAAAATVSPTIEFGEKGSPDHGPSWPIVLFLFFRFLKFVNELRREIPFICDVRAVIKNW